VLVAALFVTAVVVGAFGGAGVWAVRGSAGWGGFLAAAGFLTATVLLGSYNLRAAGLGVPLVVLTFLIAWLIACYAETRARLRRPWATLLGLCCGLLSGFLSLSLFGFNFVALASATSLADLGLILFIAWMHRTRRATAR
jgi:hypothetical protein